MSGQEAIRGFLVQTLICLLDAMATGASRWEAVTLEPDIAGDKVDIFWEFPGLKLAQQVKSSKNQIGKGAVVAWCEELRSSKSADRYQLMLAGPIAAAVLDDAPFSGVEVPIPTSMDTLALIDQAITKLDRYLLAQAFPPIPLFMREDMVSLVSARLLDGSIRAHRLTREQFDGWLRESILIGYPDAVSRRLGANCDIVWSNLQLSAPSSLGQLAFNLTLPITIVNSGLSLAVVEWFLLKVSGLGLKMLYRPSSIMTASTSAHATGDTARLPFSEFAVNPGTAVSTHVDFLPVKKDSFDVVAWTPGEYSLELWVKYAGSPQPKKQREDSILISIDDQAALQSLEKRNVAFSSIGDFIDSI